MLLRYNNKPFLFVLLTAGLYLQSSNAQDRVPVKMQWTRVSSYTKSYWALKNQFSFSGYVKPVSEYGSVKLTNPYSAEEVQGDFQFRNSSLRKKFGLPAKKNIYTASHINSYENFFTGKEIVAVPKDTFRLRNQDKSFMRKFGRATFFIGGIEVIGMAILTIMPKEVTHWKPGFIKDAKRNLTRAFTHMPVIDHDDWQINYIGHPVAGSFYYNSMRSQHATIMQSFLYSFIQSTFWEYVIEGVAEQPSIQDLLVTPIGGALLGEATHWGTTQMRKNGFNFFEKVVITIINPMYVINNGYRSKNRPRHY